VRRGAWFVAALLTATACRTLPPTLELLPADDPRPARLLAVWAQLVEERHGMRGRARLAVDGGDGAVRLRGRQIVVAQRPALLRVEVQGLLNQTLAVLVTDGVRYELMRADDQTYHKGALRPGLLWEQAYVDLTPEEAIGALLGAPLPDPALAILAAYGDGTGGVRLELGVAPDRLRRRVRFDAQSRLRWLEVFDDRGAPLWSVEFDDFSSVGGVDFAHAVIVETPESRARISLRDVELNPELSPDIFRLRAPGEIGKGG
jgi:hypothetical protein